MAEEESQSKKLSSLFDEIWKLYEFLERTEESTVSDKVQDEVAQALKIGEDMVHMINVLDLFTNNETIQELATNEIKFLLMPTLLAYFTSKSTRGERFDLVKKAQVYHVDYLRLIKLYAVKDVEVPNLNKEKEENEHKPQNPPTRPGMPDLALMERQRKAKIARYKEQKERDAQLLELSKAVKAEHVDEDVKRDYYMTLLHSFILKTQDELDSIEMEIPMLEHMAKLKSGDAQKQNGAAAGADKVSKPKKKFAPFILTKDKLQAAVFGAGYPSLPTYSVEEWFDMNAAAGRMPDMGPTTIPGGENPQQTPEEEVAAKEAAEERDDPELLRKAREWDEWKDNHRRGWGNRQNRL